jgi:hypothetical protein
LGVINRGIELRTSQNIKSLKMKNGISTRSLFSFKNILATLVICLVVTTNGIAQEIKGAMVGASTTVTATVLSVDQASRKVTIKTDSGQTYSFIAGDHVKNLAQVKVGDIITAKYTEAIAYQVRKSTAPTGASTSTAVTSAPLGSKPAAVVAQQTTVAVTVTAIDTSIPTVTFKGPEGNVRTIKVQDPQKLVGVKVGDIVDITYTEAMAVTVTEAKK